MLLYKLYVDAHEKNEYKQFKAIKKTLIENYGTPQAKSKKKDIILLIKILINF